MNSSFPAIAWITFLLLIAPRASTRLLADDVMAFMGTWKVVKFESNGKADDDPIGAIVTCDGKTMTLKLPSGEIEKGKYRLDADKEPKHFDLTVIRGDKSRVFQNIFKIEGDTMTIVFNERRQPRPTKFDVGAGDNYERIVLERVKTDRKED